MESATVPVSVVIPAYNEQNAIVAEIEAIDTVLRSEGRVYEIIVVDDGSTDETASQAEQRPEARVIRLGRNCGYGSALKAGIAEARYDWILITDADLTYPARAIPRLLAHIPQCDMVVGARMPKQAGLPTIRKPGKWVLRKYASYTVGQKVPDLNSGMRVMRKSVVNRYLSFLPSGFSFTSTITLCMLANQYKVRYEPIEYFRRIGASKVGPADFFRVFKLITQLMLRFNPWRLLLPAGALALMLGLIDFRYDIIPVDSGVGMASAGGVLCAMGLVAESRTRGSESESDDPVAPAALPRRKWKLSGWPRFAVSALLLSILFLVLPRAKLIEALHRVRPTTLLSAIPVFVLIHVLGAWKWRMLVNRAGARFSGVEALRLYFTGVFGSLFLPSLVGGDVVMLAMAFRRSNNHTGLILASLLNRALDVIALGVLAVGGAALAPRALTADGLKILNVAALMAAGAMLALGLTSLLLNADRLPPKLRRLYQKQREVLQSLRRPQVVIPPFAAAIVVQLGLLLLTAWIGESSGLHMPMVAWLLAWPLSKLVAMLPITLAGLGARELALAALLAPFGAKPEAAFTVGLAWATVLVGGGLIAGLISKILGWREANTQAE